MFQLRFHLLFGLFAVACAAPIRQVQSQASKANLWALPGISPDPKFSKSEREEQVNEMVASMETAGVAMDGGFGMSSGSGTSGGATNFLGFLLTEPQSRKGEDEF